MSVIVHTCVQLGDMQAQYLLDEQTLQLGLRLIPAGMEPLPWDAKRHTVDSCVQAHVTGDVFSNGYAGGKTLRQSGTTRALQLERIQIQPLDGGGKRVEAFLRHPVYGQFCHRLDWRGGSWLESHTTYHNDTSRPVCLEALSSVSLFDITPFSPADAPGDLVIHRLESAWSMEGRLLSQGAESLNLEPSWAKFGVRTLRFGQVGSMPVNGWFPWLMVEDRLSRVFWGCQIAHNASWQMELYRADDGLSFSGGLADYQFGHWRKTIQPGETFRTPEAILTVCRGETILDAAQRMTAALMPENPVEEERELPIVFNEYCASWGCPSGEGIAKILETLRGKPIRYFVIDAGWYKPEDKPWDQALGDWKVSKELFPQGLDQTVSAIRQAGMIPGIWFEPETVGPDAQAYHREEHLLKRDGFPITTMTRRFWDFRDSWVREYVKTHIVDFLKKYGFGYVKLDYNDTIGLGCDGAESLGEGLRQHMEQVAAFHWQLRQTLPELVVESCASGGHWLEPSCLRSTAMSSFSDAHECVAIPIIAANLHYVLLPRQSQIWAVLRQGDSPRRIVYTMAAAFLGRMCLSGDVTQLSGQQWQLVDAGIAFYRRIAPVIAQGHSQRFGPEITAYNTPVGWQGVLRMAADGQSFVVLHQFGGEVPKEITISLPAGYRWSVHSVYGNGIALEEDVLRWHPEGTFCAAAAALVGAGAYQSNGRNNMKNRIFSGEAPESAGTQTGNNRGFLDYIRIFWTHFWQLAFLNIVFCLACLPVVTIPAALAAMNRACIKLVQEGYVLVWLEFRDAFRKEFGKSLGLGILFGGLLAGSYYLLSLGLSNSANPYGLLFSGGGLCLLAITVLWGQYSFVLLPSLDLPLGAILRNGWALTFLGAPSSLGILALEVAGGLFLVLLSPISLGVALFFGVAFVQYTACWLVNLPLQKWILEPYRHAQQESKN